MDKYFIGDRCVRADIQTYILSAINSLSLPTLKYTLKTIKVAMKTTILIIILVIASVIARPQEAPKEDTTVTTVYLTLNTGNADNYTFHLYLNGQSVAEIRNGDRVIYKLHSRCDVSLSDKGHKPFYMIHPKGGAKYYLELTKGITARYFGIREYIKGDEHSVEDYLEVLFWPRAIIHGPMRPGNFWDDPMKDQRRTVRLQESPDSQLCP